MKISFSQPKLPKGGILAVPVWQGGKIAGLTGAEAALAKKALSRARKKGAPGEVVQVLPPSGHDLILLYGLGKPADLGEAALRKAGGALAVALNAAGAKSATVLVEGEGAPLAPAEIAAQLAQAARLRAWRFDKYLTREGKEKKPSLKGLTFATAGSARARARFAALDHVAEGVMLTRELVSEPANIIYPESFVERARKGLAGLGLSIEVLGPAQMKKLGMGALLGVAQGSVREPRLMAIRWNGARDPKSRPIAFVGKGITFDTGGISIKPAAGMEDMKWDMGGAGVVIGLMRALAGRKARVNAVGVVALAENMPSGTAQRPGDIVTSMSGQTIEVINTDAEGRLVLADALTWTQAKFKPRQIIDLATLTGAIIVALGDHIAGLFANDDGLSDKLTRAGQAVGEEIWRLPVSDAHDRSLDSPAADMRNISSGKGGGSCTAAAFLRRFVEKGTPWAHLDIAGVTWSGRDGDVAARGGTAFGVRLLDRFVADTLE